LNKGKHMYTTIMMLQNVWREYLQQLVECPRNKKNYRHVRQTIFRKHVTCGFHSNLNHQHHSRLPPAIYSRSSLFHSAIILPAVSLFAFVSPWFVVATPLRLAS
jgi:hypothetical protein